MQATRQRKTEIELAEQVVELGAALNDCERAIRDAHTARQRVIDLLCRLGRRPGPDFVSGEAA